MSANAPITSQTAEDIFNQRLSEYRMLIDAAKLPANIARYLKTELGYLQAEVTRYVRLFPETAEQTFMDAEAQISAQLSTQQIGGREETLILDGVLEQQQFFDSISQAAMSEKALVARLREAPGLVNANANLFSMSPLHHLALQNHAHYLEAFLNEQPLLARQCGAPFYATPLSLAVEVNAIEVIEVLLDALSREGLKGRGVKAQLNLADNSYLGNTPLIKAVCHEAVYADNLRVKGDFLKSTPGALIESGALINQANNFGRTPLHYALLFQDFKLAKQLIAKGADIFAKDKDGNTPFHLSLFTQKQVTFEIQKLQMGLSIESKYDESIEPHTAFLKDLSSELVSNAQKDRMQALSELNEILENIYLKHQYQLLQQKTECLSFERFLSYKQQLSALFFDFNQKVPELAVLSLFKEFISLSLLEKDNKQELSSVVALIERLQSSTFSREKNTVVEKSDLLTGKLKDNTFSKRLNELSDTELVELFTAKALLDNKSRIEKLFLEEGNVFQLDEQIAFIETIKDIQRTRGAYSEVIYLTHCVNFLQALRPLNVKLMTLEKDSWPLIGQSELAREKLQILRQCYRDALCLTFILLQQGKMQCFPGVHACETFKSQLEGQISLRVSPHENTLNHRRQPIIDFFKDIYLWGKKKFFYYALGVSYERPPYIGSLQAVNEMKSCLLKANESLLKQGRQKCALNRLLVSEVNEDSHSGGAVLDSSSGRTIEQMTETTMSHARISPTEVMTREGEVFNASPHPRLF